MRRFRRFTAELVRRKVFRLVGAYIAIFWLLSTGFASLFPTLGFPSWALPAFIAIGCAAIPVLAFLSWKYDLVPPQLVRDPKDSEPQMPGLGWARLRHDTHEAGYILLRWESHGISSEKRFFMPVSIGRDPTNDLELPDARVSRHHALIWAEKGTWRVRDLESTNGTFIDGTRIHAPAPLPQVCTLRFHVDGPRVDVVVAKSQETRLGY
jgi:hypothetical protein